MSPNAGSPLDEVKRYYDGNTRRFVRFGQGRGTGTIHRAVWGDGVTSRREAFHYLDALVLRELRALSARHAPPLHVLDLGCGVGASLLYLAERAAIRGTGITLSSVQAQQARARIQAAGMTERVTCHEGNFLDPPRTIEPAHLAFSIEAFVHAPDASAYFEVTAQKLVRGGTLVLCDDFLSERARGPLTRSERRTLAEVESDWLAKSLLTPRRADELASQAGYRLSKNVDLTPRLELQRPRDRLVAMAAALGRHIPRRGPRWRSLVGGHALQAALLAGLIEFRCIAWNLP
jgi:predicted O-methyltransferase YrrM